MYFIYKNDTEGARDANNYKGLANVIDKISDECDQTGFEPLQNTMEDIKRV